MGARQETVELLRRGLTPGEISKKRRVSLETTLGYLNQMVGEGRLRRSDILLSIPAPRRNSPRDADDREVVKRYGTADKLIGDIYEDVRFIEVTLHTVIRKALEKQFGEGEQGWWRQCIPEPIRKSCQARREEDIEPVADPYCYTDLCDIKTIIDKKWSVLKDGLPRELSSHKPKLLTDLDRLNHIRRNVMHPVRGSAPSEEEFDFLRNFRRRLEAR